MKDSNKSLTPGAVIIFGPPGAGKTTQALLLEKKTGFISFNTGGILERIVHDPKRQHDPAVMQARKDFDEGRLMDSSFVLGVIGERIRAHAQQGEGLIFGSNPRKMEEAFGTENQDGLLDILNAVFPKESILVVEIVVSPEVSIQRNTHRKVCSSCQTPVIDPQLLEGVDKLSQCTLCGGKLETRTLDNPSVIQVRLDAYKEYTLPIIEALKTQGYPYKAIEGDNLPFQVFNDIYSFVHDSLQKQE